MKRKTWLLLIVVLAPVLLTACGTRENCAVSHDPGRTRAFRICTNKRKYDFGEPIHITFTVTNISDETLEWNGGDEPAMDIRITPEHWSDEQELVPELTRMTLEPDESRTIKWVWPTPQTNLDALRSGFDAPPGVLSISVFGTIKPLPHATASGTGVTVHYYP